MTDQTEVHNALSAEIVSKIVRTVHVSGGSIVDIMVVTESVLVGITLTCIRFGRDEKALDIMMERARERLAEIRLKDIPTVGSA